MSENDMIGLAKAVLWEEAKGKLRALIAADGSQHSGNGGHRDFTRTRTAVEAFITAFEEEGHHE